MNRRLAVIAACCLPASLALAGMSTPQPLFLINTSPSEPPGLYVRSPLPPAPGRLVAFRTPQAGRAYAQTYLPAIGAGGILKTLVAGEGARVCAQAGALWLDGEWLGPIHRRDRAGRLLPQWSGCRVLRADQYLAFSNRVPNSFDGRYYGPITAVDLIGVFEPLWVRR